MLLRKMGKDKALKRGSIMKIKVTPQESGRIQYYIDRCSEAGGGTVVLEAGIYVTGTLCLKDNVTLYLQKKALLLGSSDIEDYPDNGSCFTDAVGHKRGKALICAFQAENIGLEGEGVIDGRGGEFPPEHPNHLIRPFLVRLVECRNVSVKGVGLRQSAAWCLHIQDCSGVRVEAVSIFNRCNGNNDGIDIDGCSDVRVEDCLVDSGDDALCLKATSNRPCRNILIRDCRVTTNWAAFKIGTESVGDFEEIEVDGCTFYDVKGCALKVAAVDGGSVRGMYLHDLELYNCTGPVFFSTGERLRQYFETGRNQPGTIENVRLERIRAYAVSAEGGIYEGKPWGNAGGGIVFSGLKDLPLKSFVMRDCCISMPGGVREGPRGPVPEMGDQYPEFHLFDPLPSWGLYIRHAQDMRFEHNRIEKRADDVRPEVCVEDVRNITGLSAAGPEWNTYPFSEEKDNYVSE